MPPGVAPSKGASTSAGGASEADRGGAISSVPEASAPVGSVGSSGAVHLPPERILALFERVSKLKSESRKYVLAYRLASELGLAQIQEAFKAAKDDLEDGDYVTMRALARRWAELDPKAAVERGLETKQRHLLTPALESWARMDANAPFQWALGLESESREGAFRTMLAEGILNQTQLAELVRKASLSDDDPMRTRILPFAAMRMAEGDPQGALQAAARLEDVPLRERTLGMVLSRVALSSPEAGRAWVASQRDLTPEQRQQYERILSNSSRTGRPRPQ